ncbi:unnamed protein product [Withania somnifera]
MSSTCYTNILILVVSLTLSQLISISYGDDSSAVVHLINNLPNDHVVTNVTVTCKIQHGIPLLSVTLVLGQDFPFDSGIHDLYVCYAEWGSLWALFNAYDQDNEDKGHPIAYYSLRDRGIYKSWDKFIWTGLTDWDN